MSLTLYPEYPVLLVDDEKGFLKGISFRLRSNGINNVELCNDSREVLPRLEKKRFSLILLDVIMPHITGEELLPHIVDLYPEIPVIVLTAVTEVKVAVDCMKNGAHDYLLKPVEPYHLIKSIQHTLRFLDVKKENVRLRDSLFSDELQCPEIFSEIITQNKRMKGIFKYIEAIAESPTPVLITGEQGVGKDKFVKIIHKLSRRKGDLITFDLGQVSDEDFGKKLFGFGRSLIDGTDRSKKGLVEQAKNGTLFLDEIGDTSNKSQLKLLRLLQEGEFYPVGSNELRTSNARFIAATNKDLHDLIKKGKFRRDLFSRFAHHIPIPPLKERKDDIPLLVDYYLELSAVELKKKKPAIPKEVYMLLSKYHFPDNIRELRWILYEVMDSHKPGEDLLDIFRKKLERNSG